MPCSHIMLIRHAEKPDPHAGLHGVTEAGNPSTESLTVRGWQRAGALVSFFMRPAAGRAGVVRPHLLFAPHATDVEPSVRAFHTLEPLARRMGLEVLPAFQVGDEAALATALGDLNGVALIAWEHRCLPALARQIAGASSLDLPIPAAWPNDRFDIVWVLQRHDGNWQFHQVPQGLLAGDAETGI